MSLTSEILRKTFTKNDNKRMVNHADDYGLETDNLFAVGDSAGGHLLGMYSNILTHPAYAEKFSLSLPRGLHFRAVGLFCGAYEITFDKKTDHQTKMLIRDFLPRGGTQEELDAISVFKNMTSDFPPTFLMTCTGDFLKDQGMRMADHLAKNNVPYELHIYGDQDHMLYHVFHLDIRSANAKECNDAVCRFFREHAR